MQVLRATCSGRVANTHEFMTAKTTEYDAVNRMCTFGHSELKGLLTTHNSRFQPECDLCLQLMNHISRQRTRAMHSIKRLWGRYHDLAAFVDMQAPQARNIQRLSRYDNVQKAIRLWLLA